VVEGAWDRQLSDMRALGLTPDEVVVQSVRLDRHWQVFSSAVSAGRVYPCFCSRKDVQAALAGASSAPHGVVPVYSGACRSLKERPETSLPGIAWRFRADDPSGAEDFIIARTDARWEGALPPKSSFVPAYNWACAIDDADGAYKLLVRAYDLESIARQQRAVQRLVLGPEAALPAIFHCALVTLDSGARLEKRTKGITLAELEANGITARELARRFEASFDPPSPDFAPGALFGEREREIKIGALGIH
jgi:glutamyl-tRNA synthetase